MFLVILGKQVTSTHEYMGLVYDSSFAVVMDNDPAWGYLFLEHMSVYAKERRAPRGARLGRQYNKQMISYLFT